MSQLKKFTFILSAVIVLAACGGSEKKEKATITEKKVELEKKKKEETTLAAEIKKLEDELAKLDTASAKNSNAKLVSITTVAEAPFIHYIELQGKVESDKVAIVTPKYGPGQVRAVYVTQGQTVSKGQLLLKLDDAVIQQQIAATRAGLTSLQVQLATAKDIYNRQNNLWKQGIGTEVQLIQARTNVANFEAQLNAAKEGIKTQERQLDATNVRAEINGVADIVNIRVGENFMGMAGNLPQIQIVNSSNLKATVQVPENYASKVRVGAPVVVVLPDINKSYRSTIRVSGKQIDINTRSFNAEAKIPSDGLTRPNQLARIRIQDYAVANTIAVPVNTIQTDENGKYVFVAVKEGDKTVARKKPVGVGELNGQLIEVKVGLKAGDQLITEGFQNLYEGQVISIVK
jgi:membrane fusion protein (multidrug efflux system)